MANLLTKFRLEYSSLEMVSLSDKPKDDTIEFFNELLQDFRTEDTEGDGELNLQHLDENSISKIFRS